MTTETRTAADIQIPVQVNQAGSSKLKRGDHFDLLLNCSLELKDKSPGYMTWLYNREKSDAQVKLSGQGEGVVGTISQIKTKKGDIKFVLVVHNPRTPQLEYIFDRIAGADECYIGLGQTEFGDATPSEDAA